MAWGSPCMKPLSNCCGKTGFSGVTRAGAGWRIWFFERISHRTSCCGFRRILPIILEVIETQETIDQMLAAIG